MKYMSSAALILTEAFYRLGLDRRTKSGRYYVAPQTVESIEFRTKRAAAKRERRYATPFQESTNDVPRGEPSRQVQRAQFRSEVKRGNRIRVKANRDRAAALKSVSQPSTLRIAAMNAVSRLSQAYGS